MIPGVFNRNAFDLHSYDVISMTMEIICVFCFLGTSDASVKIYLRFTLF